MIIDTQNQLSDAQALASAATIAATNVIDFGKAGRRIGDGEDMTICVTVDVAAGGTSPTCAFALYVDDTDGATTARWTSQTYAQAALTKGARFFVPVPAGIAGRYLGLKYVVGGTSPTLTVTAELQPADMVQNDSLYASGYTVS